MLTTAPSEEEADTVAAALLDRRLVACVQVLGPLKSRFWWDGRVETAVEWLCLVKTTADRYEEVEAAIREHHSYEVPEILVLPIIGGAGDYLEWLGEAVRPTE